MGRRSDMELVEDIVSFFIDHKNEKSIALNDFCDWIGINSATARKWLDLLEFIQGMCPDFYTEKEDRILKIKFPPTSSYTHYPSSTPRNT